MASRIAMTGMRRIAIQAPPRPTHLLHYARSAIASRHLNTSPPARQTSATPPTRPAPTTPQTSTTSPDKPVMTRLTEIKDGPLPPAASELGDDVVGATDWSRSFSGLSQTPFSKEVADILLKPLDNGDVEIKPDGIIYLPEIKYRRILNRAFGPGGWGLAPRGETQISAKPGGSGGLVTREYALICHGRLVSVARGEQDYFDEFGIPTAMEACKSNAMMRCCKDLGVASELWDPRFIRKWKKENATEMFGEHVTTKRKKKLWVRKGETLEYPYQVAKFGS